MPTTPTFNTPAGQTIGREMLIAYLNTGTAQAPVWAALGMRVSDSSMEYDMGKETTQDILGDTRTAFKKPTITQTFDPMPLDSGDAAAQHIWKLAVRDQDVQALANQDVMVGHLYAESGETLFAERYPSSAIEITGLGGEGGGTIGMPFTITYGGTRSTGTISSADGTVTFTPDVA